MTRPFDTHETPFDRYTAPFDRFDQFGGDAEFWGGSMCHCKIPAPSMYCGACGTQYCPVCSSCLCSRAWVDHRPSEPDGSKWPRW